MCMEFVCSNSIQVHPYEYNQFDYQGYCKRNTIVLHNIFLEIIDHRQETPKKDLFMILNIYDSYQKLV